MAVYYNGIETGTMYLGSTELAKKYLGNTEVAPGIIPWNPSLMPTFVSWWRADNGVTYDGSNNVTSWAPVTASVLAGVNPSFATLVVKSGGTSPKYVSQVAGMNNRPGIEFGTVSTTENLTTSQNAGSVFGPGLGCFHWYVIDTTTNANGGTQWIGGPAGETSGGGGYISLLGTNYPSYNNAFVVYAPENNSIPAQPNLQPVSSYPKALIGSFQQTSPLGLYSEGGYYLNNAVASPNNLWNTTQGYFGPSTGRLCIYVLGNDYSSLTSPFYGTILECGITGKDGPQAWSLLQDYVQERYNLTF
jgi:hypothetical protein